MNHREGLMVDERDIYFRTILHRNIRKNVKDVIRHDRRLVHIVHVFLRSTIVKANG